MIKTIIIDDEPLARGVVREYLEGYPSVQVVQECNDGFEGLKAIQQHQPQLVFLDIQMPKINGFEMLELIEQRPAVIFTTAFDEFALKAFETHAVDYLLKPFSKARFTKAMEKFLDSGAVADHARKTEAMIHSTSMEAHTERVVVKDGGKITIIPVHNIQFIEAADDYVKIHAPEGSFLKNKTMSFFEQNLPPSVFVRTHRSYILNVRQIIRIDPYEKDSHVAILKDGFKIPVSAAGYGKLKKVLGL